MGLNDIRNTAAISVGLLYQIKTKIKTLPVE